ncbi:hypothetical protein ACRAWD_06890 [Caulobacter segnis]
MSPSRPWPRRAIRRPTRSARFAPTPSAGPTSSRGQRALYSLNALVTIEDRRRPLRQGRGRRSGSSRST